MKNFTKEDYLCVLQKISTNKGAEVDFEHYYKDNKNIICMKHFNEGFFELNDKQQCIIMFVLSLIAKKLSNSNARHSQELSEGKPFFNKVAEAVMKDKDEQERLNARLGRMSSCRDSEEAMKFFKNALVRYVELPFDGYALIEELSRFDYDDYATLKKWLCTDFYRLLKKSDNEMEVA